MAGMAVPRAGSTYLLGDEELTLFLEYRGLPADQLGRIFGALAGLNQAVLTAVRDVQWQQGELDLRPELHVTSVHTGESINCKFRQGKIFPSVEFPNDDLVLVMPRWTAGFFLASALLIGGAEVLKSVDTVMQHIPHHARAQVQQYVNVDQVVNPKSQAGRDVRLCLAAFKKEIDSPNLSSVHVNEAIIRKRDDVEGPPATPPSAA
jgi:hypothetical protein